MVVAAHYAPGRNKNDGVGVLGRITRKSPDGIFRACKTYVARPEKFLKEARRLQKVATKAHAMQRREPVFPNRLYVLSRPIALA